MLLVIYMWENTKRLRRVWRIRLMNIFLEPSVNYRIRTSHNKHFKHPQNVINNLLINASTPQINKNDQTITRITTAP